MSLSRSSSQMVGKNPLRSLTPSNSNNPNNLSLQDSASKEKSPSNRTFIFRQNTTFQKGESVNNLSGLKGNDKKISVSFLDGGDTCKNSLNNNNNNSSFLNNGDITNKQKGVNNQKEIFQQVKLQKNQSNNEGTEVNRVATSNGNPPPINKTEKRLDEKANIEYKRMYDILCEENSIKQKKYSQLKNLYQNGTYTVQEKEKDPLQEEIKLKGIKGLINLGGEKSEDIIQRTIAQKKAELEVMESQIQEQIMYNQTLNFMALRTDTTLKDQKKLVLKMEKLHKIVDKRTQDYTLILQENQSQQQLTQFKMAEQVAQLINKEEIYKSIDQNRMKMKKTFNEDFQKITLEQEEISKKIALLKEKIGEQGKLINELNQVVTNVANLKMSFPYTFQKAEAMLYVAQVLSHSYMETILGDLFYVGMKENKSLILDSYLKIPAQLNNTTNNTPTLKKQKESQNKFRGSLNQINFQQDDNKRATRYEYRHQVSNSFYQSSLILKDNFLFIRLLEIIKQKENKPLKDSIGYGNSLGFSSNSLKVEKKSNKKSRPSVFIKHRPSLLTNDLLFSHREHKSENKSPPLSRKQLQYEIQPINLNKISSNIIGDKQISMLMRVKDRFLNSIRRFNPKFPDFEYRFLLRDLIQLDSKSNGYMSALESRIQKFQEEKSLSIEDKICSMFQEMTNKFIQLRSMVSLKIQEKNMKLEKNKTLKKKILQLQIQAQKRFEISDKNFQNSQFFLIDHLEDPHNLTDSKDIHNEDTDYVGQSLPQVTTEREDRNIRLMNLSKASSRSQTTSPIKNYTNNSLFKNFDEDMLNSSGSVQASTVKDIYKEFKTDFDSVNILNNKLDILKYTNLHLFSDNSQSNNNHHPFESSFIILEKTLGVVRRILQLINTCLLLAQDYMYDDIESFKDIATAHQQFNYFNNKMQEFLKLQEGRFFGSFKFNQITQSQKKNYSGGINSLLKQFKAIFPNTLIFAQKMFHCLIAHDVVVINFLDMDFVENILRDIKSKFDEECKQFIVKYLETQGVDVNHYINGKTISWNGQTLLDFVQPQKEHEEKLQIYAQKSLEFNLMEMIQNSSKLIIDKAHCQCRDTTKNLFEMFSELYVMIFSVLSKRKQIVDISKIKKETTQSQSVSVVFDQKSISESSNYRVNDERSRNSIKQPENRKSSQISVNSNKERKSIMRSGEGESLAKKNIFSVFSKALKDKKRLKEKERSPLKLKSDKFFVINEEGNKEMGSNVLIQEAEQKDKVPEVQSNRKESLIFLNTKDDLIHTGKGSADEQGDLTTKVKTSRSSFSSMVLDKHLDKPSSKIKRDSYLKDKRLTLTVHLETNTEDLSRHKASSVRSDQSMDLNSPLHLPLKSLPIPIIVSSSSLGNQSQKDGEMNELKLEKQNSQSPNSHQKDKKNYYETLFRQSFFYNTGQINPFQISLYKNKTGATRSEEESRILVSSLAYYKNNKEKTINKVIQKKLIETGEIYDGFHSSLLNVDLKTKQQMNEITSKKLVGFNLNQLSELQNDGNDINLVKEALFFEEERKNIKQQILEETKYFISPTQHIFIKDASPDRDMLQTSENKISFIMRNSPLRKTNNSLNSSIMISSPSQQIQNQNQTSLSPSQLPSIMKNTSQSNPSGLDSKVKVVKFPMVSNINKKGVAFKDTASSDKFITDKKDLLNISQTSFASNGQASKICVSPLLMEGRRSLIVRSQLSGQQTGNSLNQSTVAEEGNQSNRGRHRSNGSSTKAEQNQSYRERIYKQYNPEKFREDELILDQYKKDFLHLDQVYKATIQANKDKLEVYKNNPHEQISISKLDLNQDTLKKLQEVKKGSKLFKLFQRKTNVDEHFRKSMARQQSDDSPQEKDRLSQFVPLGEEALKGKRSKLTNVLAFVDNESSPKQKKKKKSSKKQTSQSEGKKQHKSQKQNVKASTKKKSKKKHSEDDDEEEDKIIDFNKDDSNEEDLIPENDNFISSLEETEILQRQNS